MIEIIKYYKPDDILELEKAGSHTVWMYSNSVDLFKSILSYYPRADEEQMKRIYENTTEPYPERFLALLKVTSFSDHFKLEFKKGSKRMVAIVDKYK